MGGGGKTFKDLLRTGEKLLTPYILFSLIGYALWIVEMKPISFYAAINPLQAVLWINSNGMPIAGALWFLTAMLFVDVMVFLINKYIKHRIIKIFVIAIIFVVGLTEAAVFHLRFPWSFGASCSGLGYFYFGVLLDKGWNTRIFSKIRQIQTFWYIITLIIASFSIMNNGILNMRTGQYACIPLTVINSVIFIFALWMLIYRIGLSIEQLSDSTFIRELLYIGKYSIVYLCCNEIVINIIKSILRKMNIDSLLIVVPLVFISLKICEKVLLKRPFNFIIGQKAK